MPPKGAVPHPGPTHRIDEHARGGVLPSCGTAQLQAQGVGDAPLQADGLGQHHVPGGAKQSPGSWVPPASPGSAQPWWDAHLAPDGRLVESWSSAGMVFPHGLLAETGLGRSTLTHTSFQGSGCCRQRTGQKSLHRKPHSRSFGHAAARAHLGLVADDHVVLHGEGHVAHVELQPAALLHAGKACPCPRSRAACGRLTLHH